MSIIETIQQRKSQPLIDGDISANDVHEILTCALTAPDHKCLRPWRYIVCRPEDKDRLVQLLFESSVRKLEQAAIEERRVHGLSESELGRIVKRIENKIRSAPYIVICILDTNKKGLVSEAEQLLSAGAAIQNMIVAAESLGCSCFWRTGEWAYNPYVKEALGVNLSAHITGFLGLGKMHDLKRISAQRRPLFEDHFSFF